MIVFVHGVPETGALWDGVRARIDGPSVAVWLPGFGCARPEGFAATKEAYAAFLRSEIDAIGEPVDLVGHDWGAILTYRMVTADPDGIRSWAADIGNTVHPDYVWHPFAQQWQTPGDGEAFFEAQDQVPVADRALGLQALGVPPDDALALAANTDETMAACILDLYRSAVPNPYAHFGGTWGPTKAPGMVLHATDDPFGDAARSEEVAATLGARHQVLEGVGHFWAYQDPAGAARALEEFWADLD